MSTSLGSASMANHPSTGINTALNQYNVDGIIGLASTVVQGDDIMNTGSRTMLGDPQSHAFRMSTGRADIVESAPHNTTSLRYAIDGTARIIADTITTMMAMYVDPMKMIMGTLVVEEEFVIITREYVVGGGCQITAERALAPTASLKEDQRQVGLTQYGADVAINNDIMFKPAVAQRQMNALLTHQRDYLAEKALQIMYRCVMNEGTSLLAAYQRASTISAMKSEKWRQIQANEIYVGQQFAALNKWPWPMTNLMATLAKANKYTPTSGEVMNVMIAPADFLHKDYTRPSKQYFYMSGDPDTGKSVPVPMPNTMVLKEAANVTVLIHHPKPSFNTPGGTSNPQVMHNHLSRQVAIAAHYPLCTRTFDIAGGNRANQHWHFGITDFKHSCWRMMKLTIDTVARNLMRSMNLNPQTTPLLDILSYREGDGFVMLKTLYERIVRECRDQGQEVEDLQNTEADDVETTEGGAQQGSDQYVKVEIDLVRPNMVLNTLSAIFSAGTGAAIGAFLVRYPKMMVASTQFTQITRFGIRISFGAALFARERVIIMEDVLVDGMVKGEGTRLARSTGDFRDPRPDEELALLHNERKGHDLFISIKCATTDWSNIWSDPLFIATQMHNGPYYSALQARSIGVENLESDAYPTWPNNDTIQSRQLAHRDRNVVPLPILISRGTVVNHDGKIVHTNNGHFGHLDNPNGIPNLKNLQRPTMEPNFITAE